MSSPQEVLTSIDKVLRRDCAFRRGLSISLLVVTIISLVVGGLMAFLYKDWNGVSITAVVVLLIIGLAGSILSAIILFRATKPAQTCATQPASSGASAAFGYKQQPLTTPQQQQQQGFF